MRMPGRLSLPIALAWSACAMAQGADPQSAAPPSTLSGRARPTAQAKVVKVFVEDADRDATGPLHIVYNDATDDVQRLPPKQQRKALGADPGEIQEGYSDPQVARDRKTVGWTETYDSCCQSYPIPLVLTLYRSGRIIRRIEHGQMLWSWMFLDGSRRGAVVWGPTHGPEVGDFRLYDVATGRMLAQAFGDESTQELEPDAPAWAKQLEKKLNTP
jgi:hypothetical protein